MSEVTLKASIALIAILFLVICLTLAKPASDGGRLSLKLSFINAVGWLLILPLSNDGHPPTLLIGFTLFWLINLVLLPSALFALAQGYRAREERKSYLVVAGSYLGLNLVVLFLLPAILLVSNVTWLSGIRLNKNLIRKESVTLLSALFG